MFTIDQLEVGVMVRLTGGTTAYRVAYVGAKYFHVEMGDGQVSGPYPAILVAEVIAS